MLSSILLSTTAFAVSALAAQSATVIIEASHGGAGNGLTNTTIHVPINDAYTNDALDEVSVLFLRGAMGIPVDTITCTPFSNPDGTGDSGNPFNSTHPSYLSTNTVEVASIVCITTYIETAPGVPLNPSSSAGGLGAPGLSVASSSTAAQQTTMHTTRTGNEPNQQTTLTGNNTPASPTGGAETPTGATGAGASSTSSQAASSTGNAASGRYLSGELFGGLALAGFGVAFAL